MELLRFLILALVSSIFSFSDAVEAAVGAYETAPVVPAGWKYISKANATASISLTVVLEQPGMDALKSRVDEISAPDHPAYGQHLSLEQVQQYRAVDPNATAAVTSWLKQGGVKTIRPKGHRIRFTTTVGVVNALFACELGLYSEDGAAPVLRARSYSLPSAVEPYIRFVYPLTQFVPTPKSRRVKGSSTHAKREGNVPAPCYTEITPDCITGLYNMSYMPPGLSSSSQLGIVGFLDQHVDPTDLQDFLKLYSTARNSSNFSSSYTFSVDLINHGSNPPQDPGIEATLDTQYSMSFSYPLNVTYYSTGGRGPAIGPDGSTLPDSESTNEPWLEFLEYLVLKTALPQVLSISYSDNEQSIPLLYAQQVCDLFLVLAARGVSVLIASGDGGAAGTPNSECVSNDGKDTPMFIPTFPNTCPWVTSVGATTMNIPIAAASFSAGGFSNYFGRPSWQNGQATGYINNLNGTHAGFYNASGRAFPDVAAVGQRYVILANGTQSMESGTSASTPVFATMIALINDKRLRAGKPPLGFLNPLLYSQNASLAFTDITTGRSSNCYYGDNGELGWSASAGWDPLTGLGTPNFNTLADIFVIPPSSVTIVGH